MSKGENGLRLAAAAVAKRTRQWLKTHDFCLWRCKALNGEVVAVVKDSKAEAPAGHMAYTIDELVALGSDDIGEAELALAHEAKKGGATLEAVA